MTTLNSVRSTTMSSDASAERYLEVLRKCLTRSFSEPLYAEIPRNTRTAVKRVRYAAYWALNGFLRPAGLLLVQKNRPMGETMMGIGALNNLHDCMTVVMREAVPGDFVETGVWRGGGTIYMRAFVEAHGLKERQVWACDSFEGLPRPKHEFAADRGDKLWQSEYLAVSLEQVKANFGAYGLLDERVRFVKGFFLKRCLG